MIWIISKSCSKPLFQASDDFPRKTFLIETPTLTARTVTISHYTGAHVWLWTSGAFAKWRNRLLASCPSICPSVRMEQLGSLWTDFHEILILEYFFQNPSRKFKSHLNLTRTRATLHADQYTILIICGSFLLTMRNPVIQKTKHTFLCSKTSFLNNRNDYENVEECCTAGQATDVSMAHAHCVLGN